ncbi:hypothetical protein ARAM_006402 [Aspergillus rambellii]|uniref:Aminoglycoside phosphotransferase domain-containing protein n=2 Tax=Aspergillus subgen. Nidulantes TaxID=2720870 RepID=A0A0F8XP15_9EURO|nr:hypothetical protein AOCH_002736 [Aspergillus ochraceoroseus]KKK25227.1 hypothetical protein ARAM_006402 [Aspergillus rambellii]
MKIFPESSFFKERRAAALPTPAEIRAINEKSGSLDATNFNRPALSLYRLWDYWLSQVPTPEIFGWTEDGRQIFIYMSLIEGESLQERWSGMSEGEKRAVCEELKNIVKMWRSLKQGKQDYYIGSFDKQPLNEVFLESHPKLAGPFQGANATQQFQNACGIEIDHEVPIVFTHNDFVPPNILLSPGSNPKVAAIIDWGQAGWYPAYWEYCKARRVNLVSESFDDALQEEWRKKYLPMILDPVDDEEYYNPWLWSN